MLTRVTYLEQENGDRKKIGAEIVTRVLRRTRRNWHNLVGQIDFSFQQETKNMSRIGMENKREAEERRKDKGRGTKDVKRNKFESEANGVIKQKNMSFGRRTLKRDSRGGRRSGGLGSE